MLESGSASGIHIPSELPMRNKLHSCISSIPAFNALFQIHIQEFPMKTLLTTTFLTLLLLTTLTAQKDNDLAWHDVQEWGIEGRGWSGKELATYFDRLPASAKGKVRPPVWSLSLHSAGMAVRFQTDATSIHVDYKLRRPNLSMSHMPATGVSGADLYAKDEKGTWRWVSVTRPSAQIVKTRLVDGLRPGSREYMIYFPLYNGLEYFKIGVSKEAMFEGLAPRKQKPILFYGTSITHGACASRPGMPHPAIIGRRMDMPVINLGFSGNGRMEKEVGEYLAQLDPAVYVLDCLPNMSAQMVTERAVPLVKQLRAARPDTPIVLVEDRTYTNSWILASKNDRNVTSRIAFKKAYETLLKDGVKNLYYVEGEPLLGDDNEGATDGSHPSDLGFMRQANVLEPVIRKAIRMK